MTHNTVVQSGTITLRINTANYNLQSATSPGLPMRLKETSGFLLQFNCWSFLWCIWN